MTVDREAITEALAAVAKAEPWQAGSVRALSGRPTQTIWEGSMRVAEVFVDPRGESHATLIANAPVWLAALLAQLNTAEAEGDLLRDGLRQVIEGDYPADAGNAETWAHEVLDRPAAVHDLCIEERDDLAARLETVEAERDRYRAELAECDHEADAWLDAEGRLRERASAWETVARQLADALRLLDDPTDRAAAALAAFRALDTPEPSNG